MNKHLELAIRALENMRGDNLERAKLAFRNCSPEQMNQDYGESGRTRNEIINGYYEKATEINEAIEWVKKVK